MKEIKLHVDSIGYSYKPKNEIPHIKRRTQNPFGSREYTIEELKELIEKGHTISSAVMKGGCKAENWAEQQLFMVDIDNDNETDILSLERALNICNEVNINPCFYYHSFSSTKEKPKYRLGFILNEIIFENAKREIIMSTLISLFSQSDTSTINADRIFFGTNKEVIIIDENNTFSFNDILNNYTPKKDYTNKINETDKSLAAQIDNFDFLSFLKERNGNIRQENNKYVQFIECELCGHQNDLTYYKETKTFYCFSSAVSKGGSIIDYLMILKGCNTREAIQYFKYEILKFPRMEGLNKYNENIEVLEKLEELKVEDNYTFDDKGISRLFAEVYKDNIRFNTTENEWFYYNGKIWLKDEKGMRVSLKAEEFSDNLLIYASRIRNEDIKTKFLKYVSKLGQFKYRENLIKDSKDIYCFSNTDLDENDNLFNCQNGTFNLLSFEFKKHDSSDMLSKISNVIYAPNAKASRFIKFIDEVLEEYKKVLFVQQLLGYSLTARTEVEACFIFYGQTTRNGKSTLIETYSYMLGNNKGYAITASPETIAIKVNKDSRAASNDIARLRGCRFVSMSEPPKSMPLDNAFLKNITGRDTITARYLHQEFFEFIPKFKLVINTNHLPYIADETLFASNRICVIPFNRHFTEIEQNPNLKDILKSENEISGIFNWCLEGLKEFNKKGKLDIPITIMEEIKKYKKSSDKIGLFIDDCLTESNSNITIKEIYFEYEKWCSSNDIACEGKQSFMGYFRRREIIADTATVNGKTERNVLRGYTIKRNILIEDIEVEGI